MLNFKQAVLLPQGIIETILLDGINKQQIRRGIERAHQISERTALDRYLVDASMASPLLSLLDIFELPAVYKSLNVSLSSIIAHIPSRSALGKAQARFFETVCRNRGWQVRLFEDRQEAISWLKES